MDMFPLSGDIVDLHQMGEETAGRLLEIHDPETTKNFSFFQRGLNLTRERAYISRMNNSHSDCLWGIFPRNLGSIIGTAGIHEIDTDMATCRLGIIIWIMAYQGQGIGTDTINCLVRCAFTGLGLQKVYVTCRADNPKTQEWYTKLGFVEEGVLRGEYPFRGRRLDMVRFGMLRKEWEKANAR